MGAAAGRGKGSGQLRAQRFAAGDLGASSVRVIVGAVGSGRLELVETYRTPNVPVRTEGTLRWDLPRLYRAVRGGLVEASRDGPLASVGIDSWGVDYGLLGADGRLLDNPSHYRDPRAKEGQRHALAEVSAEEVYGVTGIQVLPINTLNQLVADRDAGRLAAADRMLLIPDLVGYWLTGSVGAEVSNASTTQLLDARTGTWAYDLIHTLGLPRRIFPPLRKPGEGIGETEGSLTGAPLPVVAVGSHDTASAVVAVPATTERFAYVSCGTWSLVGVELSRPVLSADSRRANFTNEVGVDGTVRYLRNVMGLWLLQESLRTWRERGLDVDLAGLLSGAARVPTAAFVVDAGDPEFLGPDAMPDRVAAACRRTGGPVPETPAEITRCVLDSLALGHRRAVRDAARLSGREVEVVHMVGGGSRNALLCQLTADACGLPVVAGPVEASALGNVLVQARAAGAAGGDLAAMRELVAVTQPLRRYEPAGVRGVWDDAEFRVHGERL